MKRLCYLMLGAIVVAGLVAGQGMAKSYKSSGKAWLGVYTQAVDDELTEAFDLPVSHGVIVNRVVKDSPADKAGLNEDDIIIRFDGSKITDADELVEMVGEDQPGDEVAVTVMRGDDELELEVTLGERPGGSKSVWITKNPKKEDFFFSFDYNEYPYMGVSLLDLTRQLGDYFGIDKGRGALITDVIKDSPAAAAGLKAGDVIVAIDGDEVFDTEDVEDLIEDKKAGDKVEVSVIRNKEQKKFTVEVTENEEAPEAYYFKQFYGPNFGFTLPKMKGKFHDLIPTPGQYDDALGEYQEEMKKLKKELKSLREEMQELRDKLE